MIGGIEETSASSKPDPRLDPTRLRGVGGNAHPYRDSVGALEHGMIKQIAAPV
jgi:hypothetical protein